MDKPIVILMCGLPGSGKSTLAKSLAEKHNAIICSADDFFTDEKGNYNWNPDKISVANNVCRNKFDLALENGSNVIVDNTNLTWRDIKHYIFGAAFYEYQLVVQEPQTEWKLNSYECHKRGLHNVPHEKIIQMLNKLSSLFNELDGKLRAIFNSVNYNLSEGNYTCH